MVWQLSIQNGCLSSNSDDPSMTFNYPVEIARDLISMTSQFSQQSMEVHGIGLVCAYTHFLSCTANTLQIEKLFDVACSLTDVLSLLPPNPDPFQLGPRDYLNDFIRLLSILRSGDHRFLPLLLSKVHDVLPRLVNPMLQSVPENAANKYAEVDIFDGFGNAGMGVASNFPGYNGDGSSGHFKVEPDTEYSQPNPALAPYNKQMENLASPVDGPGNNNENVPFASPHIIQSPVSPMEYPGMNGYGGYQNMSAHGVSNDMHLRNNLGNYGEGVGGGGQVEFKQKYDGTMNLGAQGVGSHNPMGMMRRPPLRQGSGSSFPVQIPRSVPGQFNPLQRANSHGQEVNGMGGVGDMPFR